MMDIIIKSFAELSVDELYAILKLRAAVFVVEQECIYEDIDSKDQLSYHVLARKNDDIIGYIRLLPKGLSYEKYNSIGRVVVDESMRGTGLGKELMTKGIAFIREQWSNEPTKISAQSYLKQFYEGIGFIQVGLSYLEDDIPHIPMVLS